MMEYRFWSSSLGSSFEYSLDGRSFGSFSNGPICFGCNRTDTSPGVPRLVSRMITDDAFRFGLLFLSAVAVELVVGGIQRRVNYHISTSLVISITIDQVDEWMNEAYCNRRLDELWTQLLRIHPNRWHSSVGVLYVDGELQTAREEHQARVDSQTGLHSNVPTIQLVLICLGLIFSDYYVIWRTILRKSLTHCQHSDDGFSSRRRSSAIVTAELVIDQQITMFLQSL